MKSAKHTKYEGNPRHAKGLQILSEREYKRLAKRAASMALAAAMAASTLCAPALAVDYNAEDGTVYTGVQSDGNLWSWQGVKDFIDSVINYDHTNGSDQTITITGDSTTTDQVLNVGSGTTGLDITVDGVTAEVEGENVIKVEDGTQVGVTIKDSDLTSTGGEAAISIDGDSVMDIEGSTIKGGGKEHAAIEAKGNSKVALDNSTVTGNGTGVQVQDNATLIIGGAEIQPGTLILTPVNEIPSEVTIVGNEVTNENVEIRDGIADVTGVGIQAEGQSNVQINDSALVMGTGVVSVGEADSIEGSSTAIELSGDASLQVDGTLEAYSEQVMASGIEVDASNNTTIQAVDNAEIKVSEDATVIVRNEACGSRNLKADKGGVGIELQDNASMEVGGDLTVSHQANSFYVSEFESGIVLKDSAELSVVNEGTLAVNTLTLEDGYANPIKLGGLLYAEKVEERSEQETKEYEDEELLNWFGDEKNVLLSGTGVRYATMVGDMMKVYYQIGEGDNNKEVTIDLDRMMVDTRAAYDAVMDEYEWPGGVYNYDLRFVNKSGHEYIYKDQSFTIVPSAEGIQSLPARCPNEAIMALYGVSEEHELSLEDLILAEQKVKSETEFESLEEYYLDYFNKKYNTTYTSWYDVMDKREEKALEMVASYRNAQYTITTEQYEELQKKLKEAGCTGVLYIISRPEEGKVEVQLKETSIHLNVLSAFYNSCLGIGFGEHGTGNLANNRNDGMYGQYNNLGDYNKYDDVYNVNEIVFQQNFGTMDNPLTAGQDFIFKAYTLLDGPRTNNLYQGFSFGWDNTITLARIDPDPVPPTDPEDPTPTPDPDPDEPTLILTPVPEEEEVPEEETPLAPAPVEEIPEEETPLVDTPVIDESLEEIGEEDVPLASAPKTGDESGAFGLMAVLSGMALAVMSFFGKKKEQ